MKTTKKLSLNEIKVESFVTDLNTTEKETVGGGTFTPITLDTEKDFGDRMSINCPDDKYMTQYEILCNPFLIEVIDLRWKSDCCTYYQ